MRAGKNAASVNAAYRSNFATLGGSYSESSDYRQTGLSGRGSLVAYPWHVLASNETGTTMTIVDAPKAEGLMVMAWRWCLTPPRIAKTPLR